MAGSPHGAPPIALPNPSKAGGQPIWQLIASRRSVRRYARRPLSLGELSQLLWASQGVTSPGWLALRAAPSAGALYPIETHICANNVEGLTPGLYRYLPVEHALRQTHLGPTGTRLANAALGQDVLAKAAAVFVWTAVPARCEVKYGDRAARYIYLETGHIAENLYLAATALGLGCCAVGAFDDSQIDLVLGVDGVNETAVYICAIGPV